MRMDSPTRAWNSLVGQVVGSITEDRGQPLAAVLYQPTTVLFRKPLEAATAESDLRHYQRVGRLPSTILGDDE